MLSILMSYKKLQIFNISGLVDRVMSRATAKESTFNFLKTFSTIRTHLGIMDKGSNRTKNINHDVRSGISFRGTKFIIQAWSNFGFVCVTISLPPTQYY